MQSLHDHIIYLDWTVWKYVNTIWHHPALDWLMPWIRNQYTWAPLYLFLLVFTTMNFKKNGLLWCLGFLACFALTDSLCGQVIKPLVHRVRPCNNPFLEHYCRLLVQRSSGWSFPSNHAANHFGLAVFMGITLGKKYRWVMAASLFWAGMVAWAQVYVGVHFPLDVLCGAAIGIVGGSLAGKLFNKKVQLFSLGHLREEQVVEV